MRERVRGLQHSLLTDEACVFWCRAVSGGRRGGRSRGRIQELSSSMNPGPDRPFWRMSMMLHPAALQARATVNRSA